MAARKHKRTPKSKRIRESQQLFSQCDGNMDQYQVEKKNQEKQEKKTLNNIQDMDENKEDKEDAIIQVYEKNQSLCERWEKEGNIKLKQGKNNNHNISDGSNWNNSNNYNDTDCVFTCRKCGAKNKANSVDCDQNNNEMEVSFFDCTMASNSYLSSQIAAAERMCDETLFEKDLLDGVVEIDAQIFPLTLSVCQCWFNNTDHLLDLLIKGFRWYSANKPIENQPENKANDLPHHMAEICESITNVQQTQRESFCQNQEYSLTAICVQKLQEQRFKYISSINLFQELQSQIQGIFVHIMTAIKVILSNMGMHIEAIDLDDNETASTNAHVKWIQDQIRDFLQDDIWLIDQQFTVEGIQPFGTVTRDKIADEIIDYYDVEIKNIVICYEENIAKN